MRLSIYCLLAACLLAQPSLVDTASAEEVDTEHLFGFTEGADVGKKGEQEVVLDTVTRIGKRRAGPGPSSYDAVGTKLSYQIDLVDGFKRPGRALRRPPSRSQHPRSRRQERGQFRWRLGGVQVSSSVKSTPEQPFGLALESRPRFARVLPIEGRGADIFDFENVVHVDWQIVPNKLWYGTNISFDPAAGRQRGSGEGYRSSTFLWSNALVGEVADKTYLGPETALSAQL